MPQTVKNLISQLEPLRALVNQFKSAGRTIGIVPTMGALHDGHLSLVHRSLREADETIVTIFVNPTQFAPGEDLASYPRPLDTDLKLLADAGVKHVFAPPQQAIYPAGFSTTIAPPKIAKRLEGEFRPSHFSGVATVVLKLLNLTQADLAFFGQKDFQQQLVIRKMVDDLNVPTEIRVCPIVRDPDGLAMSSRNAYLSPDERQIALCLNQTLANIESQIQHGQTDGYELIVEMRQSLIDGGVTSVDYATIASPDTLQTVDQIRLPVVALVAAHVGNTRLIDNRLIRSPAPEPGTADFGSD